MKDIDVKLFWLNNLIAPLIIGAYFINSDNWIKIIIPVYCVIHWLFAITCITNDRKLQQIVKKNEDKYEKN